MKDDRSLNVAIRAESKPNSNKPCLFLRLLPLFRVPDTRDLPPPPPPPPPPSRPKESQAMRLKAWPVLTCSLESLHHCNQSRANQAMIVSKKLEATSRFAGTLSIQRNTWEGEVCRGALTLLCTWGCAPPPPSPQPPPQRWLLDVLTVVPTASNPKKTSGPRADTQKIQPESQLEDAGQGHPQLLKKSGALGA